MSYSDLIETAIETEQAIMGEAAQGLAEDIEGLVLEDGEVVKLDREGKEILAELVDSYKAATGPVAPRMIADNLEGREEGDVELPDSIKEQM